MAAGAPSATTGIDRNHKTKEKKMKKIKNEMIRLANLLRSRKGRLIIMAITIGLFVLAAGAPNATIGIGR